jgi:hypothetical protein
MICKESEEIAAPITNLDDSSEVLSTEKKKVTIKWVKKIKTIALMIIRS